MSQKKAAEVLAESSRILRGSSPIADEGASLLRSLLERPMRPAGPRVPAEERRVGAEVGADAPGPMAAGLLGAELRRRRPLDWSDRDEEVTRAFEAELARVARRRTYEETMTDARTRAEAEGRCFWCGRPVDRCPTGGKR